LVLETSSCSAELEPIFSSIPMTPMVYMNNVLSETSCKVEAVDCSFLMLQIVKSVVLASQGGIYKIYRQSPLGNVTWIIFCPSNDSCSSRKYRYGESSCS
jgi:hypothetical protein